MAAILDALQRVARGEAPQPPIAAQLGLRLTAVEPGRAVVELEASGSQARFFP